jgi:cytochrome P450
MSMGIDQIPRVPGWPLLGQLPEFRVARLELLAQVPERYGPIARLRLGPVDVVLITDASMARQVLVEQADAFTKSRALSRFARPLLGNGLLTSEHVFHRRQRKLLAPLFVRRDVTRWADEMVARGEAAVARWPDGAVLDVAEEMMQLTLEIVGRTLFDLDIAADAAWLGHALSTANRYTSVETSRLAPLPLSWPTPGRAKNARAIARVDVLVAQMIADRRRSGATGNDLLSLLVRARDEDDGRMMSDHEVRDEVMTMFLAGHETTANALSWTWLLLSGAPAIRSQFTQEVDQALHGRPPSTDDLEALPLTLRILKESMRLYPPAYLLGRIAERDVVVGDVVLTAGTTVGINVYGMHRRPDVFPDPLRFDPDRFIPEREAALPRSAYLPFGSGPRVCIGNHFALMEAHLLLATIGQRVTLDLIAGREPRPEPQLTLRPRELPMRLTRRAPALPGRDVA